MAFCSHEKKGPYLLNESMLGPINYNLESLSYPQNCIWIYIDKMQSSRLLSKTLYRPPTAQMFAYRSGTLDI